ncbi:hypothetical protein BDR26DRAFT_855426, partial [Obelidium mucronatum]
MYQFTTPPLAPVAQTPLAAAGEVAPPLAQVGALGAAPAAPPAGLALAITTTIAPLFAAQTAAMLAALDTQTAAMTAALTAQTVTMTAALAGQNVTMAAALSHFERRSIARSTNLLISQDRFPITPLVNNNGNIPRNFPATHQSAQGPQTAGSDSIVAVLRLACWGKNIVAGLEEDTGKLLRVAVWI